jgi:hypothetical protein
MKNQTLDKRLLSLGLALALTLMILLLAGIPVTTAQEPEPGSGASGQSVQPDEGLDPESEPPGPSYLPTQEQADEVGPGSGNEISAEALVNTIFTYRGQLTDGGSPANGLYEFRFELHDKQVIDSRVGPTLFQTVRVTNGLFTVNLNFGAVFNGTALYLELAVRPEGSLDPYTTLTPRQLLTAAPYAFSLRPGADVVGRVANNSIIEARNLAPTGQTSYGLRGETASTSASVAGVYGRVSATLPGSLSAGVRGVNAGTGGKGVGVYGSHNGSGWGVYGATQTGIGVRAVALGTSGVGLYARGGNNAAADIILGGATGDDGRIVSEPGLASSDILLISNDALIVQLDSDTGASEDADLLVQNRSGVTIFDIDESGQVSINNPAGVETIELQPSEAGSSQITLKNAAGAATISLDAEFGAGGDGRITTEVLEITGGADLSEQFQVQAGSAGLRPVAGMIVSIDPAQPGNLVVSQAAYDHAVAGVISGAGGVQPGLLMRQAGSPADGAFPVALVGRVYVWADASYGPITPGDLLTTSPTAGHAMKVSDYQQAQGAILGKAMTALPEGQALILVLVSLQ